MIDLDDPRALAQTDPSGMLATVLRLGEDIGSAYASGRAVQGLPSAEGVTAVAFCGMGGSAVPGDVVRALFRSRLGIPFDVIRGPELPAYCGPHTLVACSSYSGETAETLACFDEAVARGCRVLPVTSGGALAERSAAHGLAVVPLPPGAMAPRAAIGHLTLASLGALEAVGLLPRMEADVRETAEEVRALTERLGPSRSRRDNPAKDLAHRLASSIPVVWGAEGIGAVAALRWKTQLNENAKVPAAASSLPELDHNEVVGWSPGAGRGFFLVALRHEGEHPDVAARFPLSIQIVERAGAQAEEVWAAGRSALARLFSLVAMGDLVSVYLALLRGVDPTPIEAIDRLKRALTEA